MKAKTQVTKTPLLVSRSVLSQHHHSTIDAILKDLRVSTRRLQTVVLSQNVELQILDRLYYKGNNQHRTALFWSHVAETRRFGKRLEKLDVYHTVEALRVSFWGPQVFLTQKGFKRAWTHIPNSSAVNNVLHRLKACQSLMNKMHQCLSKAYNHLNLNMQTGAFIQLILTLTGLVSRLDVLLYDLHPAVDTAWEASFKILSVLDIDPVRMLKDTNIAPHVSKTKRARESSLGLVDLREREDIGDPLIASSSAGRPKPVLNLQLRGENRVGAASLYTSDGGITFKSLVTATPSRPSRRHEGPPGADDPADVPEPTSALTRQILESSRTRNGGKKKKKRDEIDDIFGF